ncbi:hypothetical protein [Celeribacter marinus]|uniref:hypothetical protein n=1 Tax=Celeribacter marinus TaxID=1397108 RepID=UPI00317F6071
MGDVKMKRVRINFYKSAFLVSLSVGSMASAQSLPDYTSMGGVGYVSSCSEKGLVLKSLNETYRIRGYHQSAEIQFSSSETITLISDCSAESPELGLGGWCVSGGSNAGFEINFLAGPSNQMLSPNRMSFFGQELYCQTLIERCECELDS